MIRFLQQQNSTLKILLGLIIGVFIIILVITLVPGIYDWNSSANSAGTLATIDGREVKVADVERVAMMTMRQRRIPDQFKAMVMPRIVDQLVTQSALLDAANRMGLQVSDEELQEELRTGPLGQQLFPKGQFIGQEQYQTWVANNANLTVDKFENLLKEELLLNKLQAVVAGAATVSDTELQDAYNRQNQKVKFAYATISEAEMAKSINPTDSELRAFYDRNKAQFANSIPEKRKFKYIMVDQAKAAANVNVAPDDLKKYYDSHKSQFQVPERVKVSHILITPKPGKDGKPDDAGAKAKAEDILKQVKSGANFAELAKKNSEDPGSKDNGGDLGYVQRGVTVPEFEKAAFGLNPGQISDVVHTSFGYHIIKSEAKEPAHAQSFDEVKPQIEQAVQQEKKAQAVNKMVDQVQSDIRSEGFDKAAAKFNLPVQTTDYVGQLDSIPGVGSAPEMMQAVFGGSKGNPVVARAPQGYAIVDVLDIKPPATPTFEEAKAQVLQQFKQQRASEMVQKKTQELADRAKNEHDLKKAAQAAGATYKTSDLVGAQAAVPDLGSMSGAASIAFSLDKGQISGPLQSGNVGFVLQVQEKQLPTSDEMAKGKDNLRQQLLAQKREQNFRLFAEETRLRLEKEGKIKFNTDERKRLGLDAAPALPAQGQ